MFIKKQRSFISKWKFLTIFGLVLFFSLFNISLAAGLYDNTITAVVTPENPAPKSTVSIRLDSSLISLSSATIGWYVNGKKIKEGKDVRVFEFTLPESGTTNVEVRLGTADYGFITKNFSFAPTEVSLLYEVNSYTPPFYKGKALIPPEGVVTLMAVPNFKTSAGTISSKNLIFTWTKDGVVDGNNSGLGRNTYIFNNGRLPEDAPEVEVTVTSAQNNLRGYASFRKSSINPEIIFYENNPLLGVVLNEAISSNYYLNKQELTIIAYPYYFGGKNKDATNLEYSWLINSSEVSSTGSKTGLTVRRPEGNGSSSISLSLQNLTRIFQTAKNSIMIQYGQ